MSPGFGHKLALGPQNMVWYQNNSKNNNEKNKYGKKKWKYNQTNWDTYLGTHFRKRILHLHNETSVEDVLVVVVVVVTVVDVVVVVVGNLGFWLKVGVDFQDQGTWISRSEEGIAVVMLWSEGRHLNFKIRALDEGRHQLLLVAALEDGGILRRGREEDGEIT